MLPQTPHKKLIVQSKIGAVTISTASTTTYTVTVAAKAGGGGNAFYIDGVQAPSLTCLLYTSPSPRDGLLSRMPSSA